ncbi:hypothetical protein H5407_08015 [Mitsuaria sp. WAJ17]|uniref:hypothetical protein n=1 Tax=Mitsuaria sp. WAJ17 TaxID=2761452 RepID=UPI0016030D24|nr:hypothetical protein [Mitsuaria sp. WAJ17]MBB2485176.1 hypothetical protein [Mitsuaria sp. WAJ17]
MSRGQALNLVMQRYGTDFDLRHGGGVERAMYQLSCALDPQEVRLHWYSQSEHLRPQELLAFARSVDADAVIPLIDTPMLRLGWPVDPWLRQRLIRVWHDYSTLRRDEASPAPCPLHAAAGRSGRCMHAPTRPDHFAADVFFRDEPLTWCFPRRRHIPWAMDHLPRIDYRDPHGPVLLLAGKSPLSHTLQVVQACRELHLPVRLIFCRWTRMGQQALAHFAQARNQAGCEVITDYELLHDHPRVFGGVRAALVLTQFHETFNFLAAECVHFGVPVVAYAASGATRVFASAIVPGPQQLADWLRSDSLQALPPRKLPPWGWADVAQAYTGLVREVAAHARQAPAPAEAAGLNSC